MAGRVYTLEEVSSILSYCRKLLDTVVKDLRAAASLRNALYEQEYVRSVVAAEMTERLTEIEARVTDVIDLLNYASTVMLNHPEWTYAPYKGGNNAIWISGTSSYGWILCKNVSSSWANDFSSGSRIQLENVASSLDGFYMGSGTSCLSDDIKFILSSDYGYPDTAGTTKKYYTGKMHLTYYHP